MLAFFIHKLKMTNRQKKIWNKSLRFCSYTRRNPNRTWRSFRYHSLGGSRLPANPSHKVLLDKGLASSARVWPNLLYNQRVVIGTCSWPNIYCSRPNHSSDENIGVWGTLFVFWRFAVLTGWWTSLEDSPRPGTTPASLHIESFSSGESPFHLPRRLWGQNLDLKLRSTVPDRRSPSHQVQSSIQETQKYVDALLSNPTV